MKQYLATGLVITAAFGLGFAMRPSGGAAAHTATPLASGTAKKVNSLKFSGLAASASVDLADVTFTFDGVPSHSASVGAQAYVHRLAAGGSGSGEWVMVSATSADSGDGASVFSLFRDIPAVIRFKAALQPGRYDGFRLLLFPSADGKSVDYGNTVYDTAKDQTCRAQLAFSVSSTAERLAGPRLVTVPIPDAQPDGSGAYTVTIPGKVELPEDYARGGGGLWVMAKGDGGFSQQWASFADAQPDGSGDDRFESVPVRFELKGVKPGLWNTQFGVFKADWGDPLQWVYPGLTFEVGGDAWEAKSPTRPARIGWRGGRFAAADGAAAKLYPDDPGALGAVSFVRGGNWGNAISWTMQPELNTPGYFALLGDLGCRFVRFNYDPDQYLSLPVYRDCVDQAVQNIWHAGEYPLIAPQDLPKGETPVARVQAGERLLRLVAERYRGMPVWIELCNEPHEFATWAAWKPVAERYARAVRSVDAQAFVVAPFEGLCKDGRGAATSPITGTRIDLYDGHAYVAASDVQRLFGPAVKAGLPVLLGEYGSNDPAYLKSVTLAIQAMKPAPAAIAPWAFTVKGQDTLPLVASSSGAQINFTPAGQVVADANKSWFNGNPYR